MLWLLGLCMAAGAMLGGWLGIAHRAQVRRPPDPPAAGRHLARHDRPPAVGLFRGVKTVRLPSARTFSAYRSNWLYLALVARECRRLLRKAPDGRSESLPACRAVQLDPRPWTPMNDVPQIGLCRFAMILAPQMHHATSGNICSIMPSRTLAGGHPQSIVISVPSLRSPDVARNRNAQVSRQEMLLGTFAPKNPVVLGVVVSAEVPNHWLLLRR